MLMGYSTLKRYASPIEATNDQEWKVSIWVARVAVGGMSYIMYMYVSVHKKKRLVYHVLRIVGLVLITHFVSNVYMKFGLRTLHTLWTFQSLSTSLYVF